MAMIERLELARVWLRWQAWKCHLKKGEEGRKGGSADWLKKSHEASEVIVKWEGDVSCGQSERGILGKGIFQVMTRSRVGSWQLECHWLMRSQGPEGPWYISRGSGGGCPPGILEDSERRGQCDQGPDFQWTRSSRWEEEMIDPGKLGEYILFSHT